MAKTVKKEQHINSVIEWLSTQSPFVKDKYGNFKTESGGKEYRFKIQSTSIRFEVKIIHEATKYSPATTEWMRIDSAYFKDIVITEDNKMKFGKRLFKPKSI